VTGSIPAAVAYTRIMVWLWPNREKNSRRESYAPAAGRIDLAGGTELLGRAGLFGDESGIGRGLLEDGQAIRPGT
jgi:hypothetical protein